MSQSVDSSDRKVRAAKNQALFREVNERARRMEASFNIAVPATTFEWVCECANESCIERLTMPTAEYEAIREHGARFLVAPSDHHVWPDVERILARNDHYWIVEKMGTAERLAKGFDPRTRALPLQDLSATSLFAEELRGLGRARVEAPTARLATPARTRLQPALAASPRRG